MANPTAAERPFTEIEKRRLKRIADSMLDGMEILADAGVDLVDPAIIHCGEGQVAIYKLIFQRKLTGK